MMHNLSICIGYFKSIGIQNFYSEVKCKYLVELKKVR